ncbi:MAG TPA: PfkB family carbohydrate kinase [Dongiaceae bacterium]|nr:PfkB family carbohydrate kinase [Dongiaceae bacterium]
MILVFGSLNIDLVVRVKSLPAPGETVLGPSYDVVAGGKGANQALAAARAGAAVAMVGAVGKDAFGEIALAELAVAGVDLAGVARKGPRTGAAFITVDRKGENEIVVASGANLKARQSQVADAALRPETLVVLQMEVPVRENWALARRARARGARVLLNAAPAQSLSAEALASLDWLVANGIEIAAIAGAAGHGDEDPRAAGAALAAATGIAVVVTLGSQGAVAYAGGEAWEIGALPVTPVDSTAAGDAFVGTLAAALDAGAALPGALRRASVAGALACLVVGAQPSLPTRAAVDARLKELAPARKVKAGRVR